MGGGGGEGVDGWCPSVVASLHHFHCSVSVINPYSLHIAINLMNGQSYAMNGLYMF